MSKSREVTNVLATRYASNAIKDIWSNTGKVKLEREFWISIMRAQKEVGIDIPEEAIKAYEAVKDNVDLDSINNREKITKHDVKARIEEFCELAGAEHIHKGMTSRDLTENVEQLQVIKSLKIIYKKSITALILLTEKAFDTKDLVITARTHNVAAQLTTLGKRLAMFAEELFYSIKELENTINNYPVRGLKGAVGTQLDLLTLLEGDEDKLETLENRIIEFLGFKKVAKVVGQVYPRSYDYAVVSSLLRLASPLSSFAKTLRIMAGHETMSEGFLPGQVGSSAMPHKINSRSCERINGFFNILRGYEVMLSSISGDQWNEGDVSCSVVRRVALPDSFFTIDGMLQTFITILNQMNYFPEIIKKENEHYLPFLLTTTLMMEAVKKGVGRETAHASIKKHALATVNDLRSGKIEKNDFAERISKDASLKLSKVEVQEIFNKNKDNTGLSQKQVVALKSMVKEFEDKFPDAKTFRPEGVL